MVVEAGCVSTQLNVSQNGPSPSLKFIAVPVNFPTLDSLAGAIMNGSPNGADATDGEVSSVCFADHAAPFQYEKS